MPITNQPYGMQARGNDIYVNGAPLRHIGINHALIFVRDVVSITGFVNLGLNADLASIKAAGFRFIRVSFGFYDYAGWQSGYYNNQSAYWAAVNRFLDSAHQAGLGVVAVIAWSLKDFLKLTFNAYGASSGYGTLADPKSNAWSLWSGYVSQFVSRCAAHPAVWAWVMTDECTNNIGVEGHPSWKVDGTGTDLGGGALPASMYSWGTKPEGGAYAVTDKMNRQEWQQFSRMTVNLIHKNDPHGRIVFSGNGAGQSFVVKTAVANSLGSDSFAEWNGASGITEFQPFITHRDAAFTGISSHIFMRLAKAGDSQYWIDGDVSSIGQMIAYYKGWADAQRKPFYLGSFGASSRSATDGVSDTGTEYANFAAMVQAIIDLNIPAASAWNWGGMLLDGTLALDPRSPYNGAGPEFAAWDLTHPSNAAKLALLVATNAART